MTRREFWSKQRVLLTGHTGFKGAWLTSWLDQLGAEVFGLALAPNTRPALFSLLHPIAHLNSRLADIRNEEIVRQVVDEVMPTCIIHMAAQALVRRSYRDPLETFSTNVMGTANVLDAARYSSSVRAILVVTTDKVYGNREDNIAHSEKDTLGAGDPYSASKAASEIVTESWSQSFFTNRNVKIATARAGNVVGGGDWSED